jgi:hypothetical protein
MNSEQLEIAAAIYATVAIVWVLTCYRYAGSSSSAVVFACLFWPLDAVRRLCEGARDWWRA